MYHGAYQFTCDWSGQSSNTNINAYLRTSAGSAPFNAQILALNYNSELKHRSSNFNVENIEEYIAYLWLAKDTTFTDFKVRFMVKLQSDTSDYTQNKQQTYELAFQQEMLQGDYFIKEADGWKEVHNWDKVVLTGNENNWHSYVEGVINQCYATNSFSAKSNSLIICTHFKGTQTSPSYNDRDSAEKIYIHSDGTGFGCFLDKEEYPDLDTFLNMLRTKNEEGNPVSFYYQTAELTKLACTEEQSQVLDQLNELPMFKGTNNIITANDLALLQMTYTVDMKAYIDSKIANTNAQILND